MEKALSYLIPQGLELVLVGIANGQEKLLEEIFEWRLREGILQRDFANWIGLNSRFQAPTGWRAMVLWYIWISNLVDSVQNDTLRPSEYLLNGSKCTSADTSNLSCPKSHYFHSVLVLDASCLPVTESSPINRFLGFNYPKSIMVWKILNENSRNKQLISFKLGNCSWAARWLLAMLLHPAWDVIIPSSTVSHLLVIVT